MNQGRKRGTVGRHVGMPKKDPERWSEVSELVLSGFIEDHQRTLADFGLSEALPPEAVSGFLEGLPSADQFATGAVQLWAFDSPSDAFILLKPTPAAKALDVRVRRLRDELSATTAEVVRFLFTGRAFDLPWICVEDRWTALVPLGRRYTIHVAAEDVSAEDVRRVYNEARNKVMGEKKKRALGGHVVAMVMLEGSGRLQGLTWAQRYQAWIDYAGTNSGMSSARVYMNSIKRQAKRSEWVARFLSQCDGLRGQFGSERAPAAAKSILRGVQCDLTVSDGRGSGEATVTMWLEEDFGKRVDGSSQ